MFSMSKPILVKLLRRLRTECSLTQSQLAYKIGQTQSYVSKYESGERRLDLIELEKVCNALGVSLKKFVELYLESR
jgi:transcriptional regulator with XRE-family HTH domain